MKKIFLFAILAFLPTSVFAFSFDGDWYGTNPCAYFDKSQDVKLVIEDGKAKVDWGDEYNPTKYRGKVLKNNKLGLNSNEGRIEGIFISENELILNKGKDITNSDGETISCEFTLNKGAMKEEITLEVEKTPEEIEAEEEQKTITEVEQNIENIPDFYNNPPNGGKIALYATAAWESMNLEAAKQISENLAVVALGKQIQSYVTSQTDIMIEQIGLNGDETLNSEMLIVGDLTSQKAISSGYRIDKQVTVPKGSKYVVYILIEQRLSLVNKILINEIKNTDTSEEKLKAAKAFQELEDSI